MLLTFIPKKLSIITNDARLTCAQMREQTGCDICINGTLYNMSTFIPVCDQKINGIIMSNDEYAYVGYGWNNGDARANVVVSTEIENPDWYDNFISGIMMVTNGSACEMYYDKENDTRRGRTAIGYMPDGQMFVYCAKDSTEGACTVAQLQNKMLEIGCESALNLDGGQSTQLQSDFGTIEGNRTVVANYICIWIDNQDEPPIEPDNPEVEPEPDIPNPEPDLPEPEPDEPPAEPDIPTPDPEPPQENKPEKPRIPNRHVYPPNPYSIADITNYHPGQKIRYLTLISKENDVWTCKCDCGQIIEVKEKNLQSTNSCGCKDIYIRRFNPYLKFRIVKDNI